MKIRIYDDTIRLRLDRSEVEQIGAGKTATVTAWVSLWPPALASTVTS